MRLFAFGVFRCLFPLIFLPFLPLLQVFLPYFSTAFLLPRPKASTKLTARAPNAMRNAPVTITTAT